jgi:hypothetical protein
LRQPLTERYRERLAGMLSWYDRIIEGAVRVLVMPGLVGVAGFHRRDDMHEAGTVATDDKHPGERRPPCGCGSWQCVRW